MAEDWRTPETDALIDAILRLDSRRGGAVPARPVHTRRAARHGPALGRRPLLDAGLHYAEISKQTGASTATITRIASWLNHGEGGYRRMLDKLKSTRRGSLPYPTGGER